VSKVWIVIGQNTFKGGAGDATRPLPMDGGLGGIQRRHNGQRFSAL